MKCEGNQHHAKYIEAIVRAGIPVQGHIGITPMRMPQLGGFFAQGKTAERAKELVDDACAMVDQPLRALGGLRSEEHTSELQSRVDLVCRLLLERNNDIMTCEGYWRPPHAVQTQQT